MLTDAKFVLQRLKNEPIAHVAVAVVATVVVTTAIVAAAETVATLEATKQIHLLLKHPAQRRVF